MSNKQLSKRKYDNFVKNSNAEIGKLKPGFKKYFDIIGKASFVAYNEFKNYPSKLGKMNKKHGHRRLKKIFGAIFSAYVSRCKIYENKSSYLKFFSQKDISLIALGAYYNRHVLIYEIYNYDRKKGIPDLIKMVDIVANNFEKYIKGKNPPSFKDDIIKKIKKVVSKNIKKRSSKKNKTLDKKTVKELREMCKRKRIKGYSSMRKNELLKVL